MIVPPGCREHVGDGKGIGVKILIDSSVSIVTRLQSGRLWYHKSIPDRGNIFLFSTAFRSAKGDPTSLLSNEYRELSSTDKAAGT
jgi:hypothetical protein